MLPTIVLQLLLKLGVLHLQIIRWPLSPHTNKIIKKCNECTISCIISLYNVDEHLFGIEVSERS